MARYASILLSILLVLSCSTWAQEETSSPDVDRQGVAEELEDLELYSDIVVIQKKFFEKTSRWEFSFSGLTSLNNKFFTSIGAKANLGYHLSERWAIEGQFWYLAQIERGITSDLDERYTIRATDIVTPVGYFGLNLVWSPIYGKLSLREKSINPFELFFTIGGGMIMTEDDQSVPAINLSFGQIHPLSKDSTLRWEIGGNIFSAKASSDVVGPQSGKDIVSEILYISVGASFFLPEIKR